MNIQLLINGVGQGVDCDPSERLLSALRRLGYYGVKFGDEHGLTGADTVLLDGKPVNAGSMLAAQAEGHWIVTIEGLPSRAGREPRASTPSKRHSSRRVRSSVGTALQRRSWLPRRSSIRTQIRRKKRSGRRFPVSCVAAPDMRSPFRQSCARRP
jgi:hypothetical protein